MELTKQGGLKLGHAHQTTSTDQAQALVWLWHRRLGHLSFGYLKKLQPHLFLRLSILDFKCDICELAKSHRISYLPSLHKSIDPFAVIHSDVWGPAKVSSFSNARYFVTFIDECTRMTWISLIRNKSEVSTAFQEFQKMVLAQYQRQIRTLQSDNGTEFMDQVLGNFLQHHGI